MKITSETTGWFAMVCVAAGVTCALTLGWIALDRYRQDRLAHCQQLGGVITHTQQGWQCVRLEVLR